MIHLFGTDDMGRDLFSRLLYGTWTSLTIGIIGVLIAFVLSAPLSYFIMNKWLQNFAYKVDLSWWIFGLAGMTAMVIALLTVGFQSIKAALKNPVDALRYE